MRVAVRNLPKRVGPLEVVSGINLAIEEGEMFTLLGPSGCGKTTLLRLIAGFYAPDEGEVCFDERKVNDVPPHERGIDMKHAMNRSRIVLWVNSISTELAFQAMGLGVRGILRKTLPTELQVKCLQKVQSGELWFEKALTDSF